MKKHLIIDSNYLCHRAQNTTGHLAHKGEPTGIAFGMFRMIEQLREEFQTNNLIFCWDYGRNLRIAIDSNYKSNRSQAKQATMTKDELELAAIFQKQMADLRSTIIPALGFNSLYSPGYEADDLIAEIASRTPKHHQSIVVSSDGDLFQLLDQERVVYYRVNQKVVYTEADLLREYCVTPTQWADVKAIAGCKSDNVKGVFGVGEKTASKYINGSLRPQSQAFIDITNAADLWTHNLKLVTLPLPGTPRLKIKRTEFNQTVWHDYCEQFGFTSLGGGRQRGKRF